jgi:very-short-patch-repair endonuclease
MLAVQFSDTSNERIDGLARAAQWLSDHTRARVVFLLDRKLSNSLNIASIDFESVDWPEDGAARATTASEANEENKLLVWPLIGRPHPASPGEQLLAAALEQHPRLRGVFQFNQRVRTVHDTTYIVDLLAQQEKVIIEIDGYRYHSNRTAFGADRQRDYELHTSGYLVLRIPHHELVADLEVCLAKVQRMLGFRQHHPHIGD